jgi:hypothetical protein
VAAVWEVTVEQLLQSTLPPAAFVLALALLAVFVGRGIHEGMRDEDTPADRRRRDQALADHVGAPLSADDRTRGLLGSARPAAQVPVPTVSAFDAGDHNGRRDDASPCPACVHRLRSDYLCVSCAQTRIRRLA